MKNLLLIFIILFVLSASQAQSFSSLKEYSGYGNVLYEPSNTQIINSEGTKDEQGIYIVMKTKVRKSSEKYYIIKFDEGPSEDPSYHIFSEESKGENTYIGSVEAEKLIIPGNGYLYSSGKTNQLYNKKQKFMISGNTLVEVKQGAYYIGLKTQTNTFLTLYAAKNKDSKVASLPKNYNIEVLIEQNNWFLIKTPFGLTGWVNGKDLNTYDMTGENLSIKRFFYMGD